MDSQITNFIKKTSCLYHIKGTSMYPFFNEDETVVISPTKFSKIIDNNIVMVKKNNQLFVHRVIYRTKKYLITKGDNNHLSDGRVYPHQYLGQVTAIKNKNKVIKLDLLYNFRSLIFGKAINQLIKDFDYYQIHYVALKGLPVYWHYYHHLPKKHYVDFDILISKNQFAKVQKILLRQGYRLDKNIHQKKEKIEFLFFKTINQIKIIIDVHLAGFFFISEQALFDSLYPKKLINDFSNDMLSNKVLIKSLGIKYYLLKPDYLFIYLCCHFAFHHNYQGVHNLGLITQVVKKAQFSKAQWQNIITIINRYQLDNYIDPVFQILKKYYNITLPLPISNTLKKTTITRLINDNIFNIGYSHQQRYQRFINGLLLSPYPWYKKIMIIVNLDFYRLLFRAAFLRLVKKQIN